MGKSRNKLSEKASYKRGSLMVRKVAGDSSTGHGFAQSRKNKCLKKYKKMMRGSWKEDGKKGPNERRTEHKKLNDLLATRKQYQLEKKAKEQRMKDIQEAKQRKKEMAMKNIEKRRRTSKALRKRTRKGQPVMKSQIEYILDKIGGGK